MDMRGNPGVYKPWTKEDVERRFRQIMEGADPYGPHEETMGRVNGAGGKMMKQKLMSIKYTCPEDKVNLGEADIMGYILQKLGELGAYDISIKASSVNKTEPVMPKVPESDIKIPEFMKRRSGINLTEILQIVGEEDAYGKTV